MDEEMMNQMMGINPMVSGVNGMEQGYDQYGWPPMDDPTAGMYPQNLLGRPAPRLSQTELANIAKMLGLVNGETDIGIDEIVDPMMSAKFNLFDILGGQNG